MLIGDVFCRDAKFSISTIRKIAGYLIIKDKSGNPYQHKAMNLLALSKSFIRFHWQMKMIDRYTYLQAIGQRCLLELSYNIFSASLMTCSTVASGSAFRILATALCVGACAKPNITRAATASS